MNSLQFVMQIFPAEKRSAHRWKTDDFNLQRYVTRFSPEEDKNTLIVNIVIVLKAL